MKEIKVVAFYMGGSKAPSPNGISGYFFQTLWEIISKEVMMTIQDFQYTKSMLKDVKSTFLALIPKDSNAISFSKFRSINLCNFLYKIIAKVLANRVKEILPWIISPNQGGFVSSSQILDGIITSHEVSHLALKSNRDRMLLKLDVSKAYDRVDCSFLLKVLGMFSFGEKKLSIIKECISSNSFLVLINRAVAGYFLGRRDLCHGNPLSPFILIIMVEALGRSI